MRSTGERYQPRATEQTDELSSKRRRRRRLVIVAGLALPLVALTPEGRLRIFQAHRDVEPKAGWTVLSLAPPKTDSAEDAAEAAAS